MTKVGEFTILVYNNGILIDDSKLLKVTSASPCPPSSPFRCPKTDTCTSNYQYCSLLDFTSCSDEETPFKCFESSTTCVKDVESECCDEGVFCPHSRTCVASETECCSTNSETPIFCVETQTCVAHDYECCSNYLIGSTFFAAPMVKCSDENKCVPWDSSSYCFQSYDVGCSDPEFSHFCANEGRCRRSEAECATTKVCPPGYTHCPDNSCIEGL